MTKKHYKLIAAILNKWILDKSLRALLAVEFGKVFAEENEKFDLKKWHDAFK